MTSQWEKVRGRGAGGLGALTRSLAVLDPIRAGQVERSNSVSGEGLHLPNLHPAEPGGGRSTTGVS